MNSLLNINIRVLANQARTAARDVERDLDRIDQAARRVNGSTGGALNGAGAGAGNLSNRLSGAGDAMSKFGKNAQWSGRQLQMAFTLPIMIAGGAAVKWQLDNEAAMTSVAKVYGDGTRDISSDLTFLGSAFETLSGRMGVNQAEVINIGSAWAQAGQQGVGLANATKLTLQAMVVGGQSAEKATESLIAVQAAYGLSTDTLNTATMTTAERATNLTQVMADLNSIENATAINMQGLIDVITRAGGTAKSAGISIQQLAAMAAALVPAGGSAAQVGNSLRTIISRIQAPTKEATALFAEMGLETNNLAWSQGNAMQRMELLSDKFMALSDAQKAQVSASAASRWQINRFDLLMESLSKRTGTATEAQTYYSEALKATADQTKSFNNYNRELNTFLNSNPQRFKILWTVLKNTMAAAVKPMIPMLISLLKTLLDMVQWFSRLSPEVQKAALMFALVLAATGPIIMYFGALVLLIGTVIKGFAGLSTALAIARGALAGFAAFAWAVTANVGRAFLLMARGPAGVAAAWAMLSRTLVFTWIGVRWIQTLAVMSSAWQTFALFVMIRWSAVRAWWSLAMTWMGLQWMGLTAFMSAAWNKFLVWSWVRYTLFSEGMVAAMAIMRLRWAAMTVFMAAKWRSMLIIMAAQFRAIPALLLLGIKAIPGLLARAFAVIGPLLLRAVTGAGGMIVRAVVALAGVLGSAAAAVAAAVGLPIWAVVAIVAAVLAAIAGLLQKFYDGGIGGFVKDVGHAFAQLPKIIANVFRSIISFISKAITVIRDWLSYLNPFQRHSPSLVDNVTNGIGVILSQYARLKAIPGMLSGAKSALAGFQNATGPAADKMANVELAATRKDVVSAAPNSGGAFDALASQIATLRPQLRAIGEEVASQEAVVDRWETALNGANAALDKQDAILDRLKTTADGYKDQLDATKAHLDDLKNAQISGYGAAEDAIFENEMAQKRLRLEMEKMGGVDGVDKIKDQMSELQGSIEKLQGQATSLRLDGAGAEITGPMQAQIKAMQDARDKLGNSVNFEGINALQHQLDELEHQATIMDLEKSLNFDGLIRQVDKSANRISEMPFDQLMADLQGTQNEVTRLTGLWGTADEAVSRQQAVVDQAKAARDELQMSYDAEKDKLDALRDAYSQVEQQINDSTSAMNDFAAAVRAARDAAKEADETSNAVEQFRANEGIDYPDVGGPGASFGDPGSQAEMDQWLADEEAALKAQLDGMGGLDMFKPIKEAWTNAINWVKESPLGDAVRGAAGGLDWVWEKVKGGAKWAWDGIKADASETWGWIQDRWDDASGFFSGIWNGIKSGATTAWNAVSGAVSGAWNWIRDNVLVPLKNWIVTNLGPIWEGFKNAVIGAWNAISGALMAAWTFIRDTVFQPIWDFITTYIVPIFQLLWNVVALIALAIGTVLVAMWNLIKDNVFDPIVRFINEDLSKAWNWLGELISTVWNGIKEVAIGAWNWVRDNVFQKIVDFINNVVVPVWNWLKDAVTTVWTAIKDAAVAAWGWVRDNVLQPTIDFLQRTLGPVWEGLKTVVSGAWEGIKTAANTAWSWVRDNVLDPMRKFIDEKLTPIWNGFKATIEGVWSGIKSTITSTWDTIETKLKSGINWMIRAFNKVADTMNGLPDFPGKIHIDRIPELAIGGVVPAMAAGGLIPEVPAFGGVFDSVRAIVGEGSNIHPEYVIPTDPRYRQRAIKLYKAAGSQLLESGGTTGKSGGTTLPSGRRGDGGGLHFYGDLSFPNVKSGEDAESFIDQLERLAD